jgi:dTDP-4-dehydrorhamnose 3,5-epimerase
MNSRFDIIKTPLLGLSVILRHPIGDERGELERLFCLSDLTELIEGRKINQVNRTQTALRGTVRGMHFQQAPHAEMKFVSCLRGEVLDVVVDIREHSLTRYQWHAEILSPNNHKTLVIPEGFAHGFQSLTEDCEMLYFHTECYQPLFECGLNPSDPFLSIDWPLPIRNISARDSSHPYISSL